MKSLPRENRGGHSAIGMDDHACVYLACKGLNRDVLNCRQGSERAVRGTVRLRMFSGVQQIAAKKGEGTLSAAPRLEARVFIPGHRPAA